jgi:putative selenate reductase molybdopterin-binding subunit
MDVQLTLNGTTQHVTCAPGDSLLTVLRRLGCFSVRFGSGTGETGAAAVLLDGRLVSADVLLAAQAGGHEVTTVESLDVATGELHPIQAAFVESGALQSGYSAGAMVLATKALLERDPYPTEPEIRDAFSGILDRETGYVKVVDAVLRAAAVLRGEKPDPMAPVVVQRAADGGGAPAPDAPLAVPRLVPSADVPPTSVVGKGVPKVDAVRLVKGNPAFVDDVELRGMLWAKVLRSPHAHARIVAIDDADARALPGVHAVLHTFNTPRVKYASGGQSWPNPRPWDQVSFDDKVRHVGDRVAAVAAESPEIAAEACRLIHVTYDVLPHVLDEVEAISPGAPVIHDETDTEGIHDAARNTTHHIVGQTVSDEALEAAFAQAPHVFERTFHVQQQQQCPIEPHITIGWLDEDERLVLRSSTQVPFHVRRMVAPLLGLPVKRIRVVKPRIGGGFGGKQEMLLEDVVGHLVLATRRPVRLELTREEEFVSSRIRHAQTITFRSAVDADGHLLAQDLHTVGNTGPYATHGFTVQSVSGQRGLSEYNCPAKRFTADVAYTNRPVAGAFRGYGAPQALFALESHMDDIARGLGLDPIELRRRNWVREGDPLDILPALGERGASETGDLPRVTTCATDECVAQARRAIRWERREDPEWRCPPGRPNIRRGLGFALCMQATSIPDLDMGGASIKINDDGSFNLLVGATDLGTGADTVLAQIAAEVLGVGADDVVVYAADTDLTPFDVGAYADSTTYISGTAVKKAAEIVRERIVVRAARLLELDEPADIAGIELRNGEAWAPDGRSVTLQDVALHSLHVEDQEQIMATASHVSSVSPPPFAAQTVEVEVDVDTGQVTVQKMVMAVDCGVAINPTTASGQVEGAMAQALGYAMTEDPCSTTPGARSTRSSVPTGSSGPTTCRRWRSSSCRPWSRAGRSAPSRSVRSPSTAWRPRCATRSSTRPESPSTSCR